ncbi:hypothetical protein RHSIM_Rhsim07G0123600 [Rhododendron simsii]|uniref:Tobamovirus multiplication protein 2B n=1 Tax=Rhododendron simsii TaxID=118357 RepID=A0A834GR06_RHOSS|nr:hypothetical protein RHSIM_Rhsim07G0123600 [Rhododendron simsii]
MAANSSTPAVPSGGSGGRAASIREGNSYQVSCFQVHLAKLPRNLLAKTSTIKNTEQILEQMPHVISSLDAHLDNGLQSVPHLKTVTQLLANMESCQLKSLSKAPSSQESCIAANMESSLLM